MKRLLLIQLFSFLVINAFPNAGNKENLTDTIYTDWEVVIANNDTIKLKQMVLALATDPINERNHVLETNIVHTAIDYLNPYALSLLAQYNIGQLNSDSNKIKPLDYILDDNFESRMLRAYNEPIFENENLMQRLYFTLRVIYIMQQFKIDERSAQLMRARLEKFYDNHKDLKMPPAIY